MLNLHEHEASFLEAESLGRRPFYSENQFKDLWDLLAAGKDCVFFFPFSLRHNEGNDSFPTENDS